ncbi:MAG: hypothetical protein JSV99_00775 [Planctomycetota bacterium]|nr:MAG: hypothetical protein JSV99_00775 [Planctomycetota bacterium]
MKPKTTFTKKDLLATLACVVFLLLTVAAVGPRGRRHAKDMLCLSNLSKWGTVFHSFLQYNNGKFMRGMHQDSPYQTTDYWMDALRPYYANNHKLRCCPEAAIPGTELGQDPWGMIGSAFVAWGAFEGECGEPSSAWGWVVACDYGSYGMNAWNCDSPYDDVHWPPYGYYWRTPNVAGANHIPLLGDHPWLDCWPDQVDEPPEYDGQPWPETSQMGRVCINRHQGFVNWVFLDFSARKVGLKELWTLKWHRRYEVDHPAPIWPPWMQNFPDY